MLHMTCGAQTSGLFPLYFSFHEDVWYDGGHEAGISFTVSEGGLNNAEKPRKETKRLGQLELS